MLIEINTDSVSSKDSSDYWSEQLSKVFNCKSMRSESMGAMPFRAHLRSHQLSSGNSINKLELTSCHSVIDDMLPDMLQIMIPLSGGDDARWDNKTAYVDPGNIYILNGAEEVEVSSKSSVQRLILWFPKEEIRKTFPYIDEVDVKGIHPLPADKDIVPAFANSARAFYRHVETATAHDAVTTATLEGSLMNLLYSTLFSLPCAYNDRGSRIRLFHKERIKKFIQDNLQSDLNIGLISSAVNLSQSYIYNLFSNEPISLMKLVWQLRIDRCRRDLEAKTLRNRSIREIAFRWGFNDAVHFSHLFHQYFGVSPTEYREQYKE